MSKSKQEEEKNDADVLMEEGEDEKDEAMDVDGEVPDEDPMSDVEAHSDHEPIQMGRRTRAPKLWFK